MQLGLSVDRFVTIKKTPVLCVFHAAVPGGIRFVALVVGAEVVLAVAGSPGVVTFVNQKLWSRFVGGVV